MTRSTIRGRIFLCVFPLFAGLGLVPFAPAIGQDPTVRPTESPAPPAPGGLTVEEAIRRTLDASPYRSIAIARREAADAARAIAALKPQPTIELTAENFGIPINGLYDQFQITGTYSQRIERGGKRGARVALAETERTIADAELVVARLDLIKTVQMVFVEAQAEAAKLAIAQERLRVARALRQEVGRRVASARDPVFAGTRAQTAVNDAEADVALAEHARDASMRRLAALWGGVDSPRLAGVSTFLLLPKAQSKPLGPESPDRIIAEARIARTRAQVDLERANGARDLTVSAGPRLIASGGIGAVAGVSMPLGGRRIADVRVAQVEAEGRRIEAEMALDRYNRARAVALAAEQVEESRHEVELLRGETLDNAERTVEQVRFGYNRGFFSFADVSAAQSVVVNTRARIVDAAERYHVARAELDRLTGRYLDLARGAAQ